jgi:hypothetical protein
VKPDDVTPPAEPADSISRDQTTAAKVDEKKAKEEKDEEDSKD